MEQVDVDRLIGEKLQAAGLVPYFVKDQSQLLEFPEEYFAEIVLNDGSKVDEATIALDGAREELERRGARLDYIVRALWKVGKDSVVPGYSPAALPDLLRQGLFSLPLRATLESGTRKQEVGVEISPDGYAELKRIGRCDDDSLRELVADFLKLQLSLGGTGYWNPTRYPHQEVNAGAVLYLRAHPVSAT